MNARWQLNAESWLEASLAF